VKNYFFFKYQPIIILISISLFIYLLGLDFIKFSNYEWLYSGDLSTYHLGWKYFRNDIWRFPIGLNPNYGIYLNTSIIFSDSIPFLAIFFKSIRSFIPNDFQYFSLWILICIYLQLFFSFKIIYKLTNDLFYSLVASLFFCFATIFLHRSAIHLSLMGQWIILSYFYIEILNTKHKFFFKSLNIIFSLSVHFYFTIILMLIFVIEKLYNLFIKKELIKKIIIEFLILIPSILFFMYVLGYFSLDLDDSLGWGYGYFNLNLNSFFNPLGKTNLSSFSWSIFFSGREYQNGEIEGFSYLGISGMIFFSIFIVNMFTKKYNIVYTNKIIILISLLFFLLSVSNNINFGSLNILTIPISNFLYAIMSSIRASGRLIWPVYYLVFIVGIVFIYKNFNKRISLFFIISLFCLQIIDLSKGLTNYKFGKQYYLGEKKFFVKNKIWQGLSNNFSQIRLLEPKNQSKVYYSLSKILHKENFLKTDIIYLARVNRQIITNKKYELIKLLNEKNLDIFEDTLFVSDNINVVRYLRYIYKDKLYYYNVDNLWIITKKIINQNIPKDSKILKEEYLLNSNKNEILNFKNKDSITGLGWDTKKNTNGLILDGFESSILLKIIGKQCTSKSNLNLKIDKYYPNINDPIKIKFFVNKEEKKDLIIDKKNKNLSLIFNCISGELNNLLFIVDEPKSLFDLKTGLNRNKRSIILKSISVTN
jgi:hypothetical protein